MDKDNNTLKDNYLLDKTGERKVGNNTYVVSSFLRVGDAPTFLDVVEKSVKRELQNQPRE